MLRILLTSSKGGCGKTTVATNLAAYFAQDGKNTVLVDADRQGSAQRWCERRPNSVPGVLPISGLKRGWETRLPTDTERVVVDSPAGMRASEVAEYLDLVDAVLVPVLPSSIDLDASQIFLSELAALAPIKRGKVPVGLVANRMKPWTTASQQALDEVKRWSFPILAQLRDTQGYVLTTSLGKGIFDYNSELVRSHQQDWEKLLRWLKKLG
jgi:chromosome partitioning protein